nr:hypothetical protein [Nitrosomonas nitrosa]
MSHLRHSRFCYSPRHITVHGEFVARQIIPPLTRLSRGNWPTDWLSRFETFETNVLCRVELWRGADMMAFRFHTQLIDPDGRVSRIRLSD